MLDLHGLHATEATEVVEEFLLAVSCGAGVRCVSNADRFLPIARAGTFLWLGYVVVVIIRVFYLTYRQQRTLSSAKKNTRERRIPRAVRRVLVSRLASASGCTSGDTPGASVTASSASTRSPTHNTLIRRYCYSADPTILLDGPCSDTDTFHFTRLMKTRT